MKLKAFLVIAISISFFFSPYYLSITWAEEGAGNIGAPSELPEYKVHIVEAGENLHLLSAEYYNNARLWYRIYNANRDRIEDPNIIHPGQKLLIPVFKEGATE